MPSPLRRRVVLLALVVLVALGAFQGSAAAQPVQGRVHAAGTGQPLAGAVVVMLDSLGGAGARTLTDDRGAFRLVAGRPAAQLRITRIGYAPALVALSAFTGVVEMQPVGVALSAVRVSDRAICPDAAGRAGMLALWEQARAALLTSVVARDARPADVGLLAYQRTLDARGRKVLAEKRELRRTRTSRPYKAVPADVLARTGYRQEHDGGYTYLAPDADVLLDPAFAQSHCFAVVTEAARPGEIGLRFTPARTRSGFVDVEGVLWLTRESPELRRLEFAYVGLERKLGAERAGGFIDFATIRNGAVILSRWSIRTPVLVARRRAGAAEADVTTAVSGVIETGGVVMDAAWSDGAAFAAKTGRITGQVRRDDGAPAPGALVALEGLAVHAVADSAGAFTIGVPLAGEYTVTAADTTLPVDVPERSASQSVTVAEGREARTELRLPAHAAIAEALCATVSTRPRGPAATRETAPVVGRVVVPGGSPAGLLFTATWLERIAVAGRVLRAGETTESLELDEGGAFFFCDVARERPLRVRIRRDDIVLADTTLTIGADAPLAGHTLVVDLASRARAAQRLEAVRVTADRSTLSPAMRAFEERRQGHKGGGRFIDETALRRSDDGPMSVLLASRLGGVRFVYTGTSTFMISSRVAPARDDRVNGPPPLCYVSVVVDGFPYFTGAPGDPVDVSKLNVRDYAAVEFYPGDAALPIELARSGNRCGTLVLWTRER